MIINENINFENSNKNVSMRHFRTKRPRIVRNTSTNIRFTNKSVFNFTPIVISRYDHKRQLNTEQLQVWLTFCLDHKVFNTLFSIGSTILARHIFRAIADRRWFDTTIDTYDEPMDCEFLGPSVYQCCTGHLDDVVPGDVMMCCYVVGCQPNKCGWCNELNNNTEFYFTYPEPVSEDEEFYPGLDDFEYRSDFEYPDSDTSDDSEYRDMETSSDDELSFDSFESNNDDTQYHPSLPQFCG